VPEISSGDDGSTTRARRTTRTQAPEEPAAASVCPVALCPICTAISVVNRASPEVVEHLLSAAREFLLATKAVVDARAADYGDDDRSDTMQRIEIG
jgi:hypothetical protein